MKNEEKKQQRADELRVKISYAEQAREAYKENNNYLYVVNSFYLDELKQELEGLKQIQQDRVGLALF
ncbi:MAG: hypothetical protein WGN25_04575 [Candidatus Electrothrix sp. GW3-4]|uniref:hypothetical protein n=1 Tax=Candidatus Electrothrix sp. GW3-4 TaxID=3126740 RepID=UPI0030D376A7